MRKRLSPGVNPSLFPYSKSSSFKTMSASVKKEAILSAVYQKSQAFQEAPRKKWNPWAV
jgi:hypothetical protein